MDARKIVTTIEIDLIAQVEGFVGAPNSHKPVDRYIRMMDPGSIIIGTKFFFNNEMEVPKLRHLLQKTNMIFSLLSSMRISNILLL